MKQNNSLAIIVVIMALVSFLCLSLSVSYSFIISSISSSTAQTIATSNLNAEISFTNASLAAEPMSDADGLRQNTYGLIDITKENDYSVYYTINLKYDTSSLPSGVTTDSLLPMENLKVALFEIVDGNVSTTPIVGPVRVADLPVGKYTVQDSYQSEYFLANGTFSSGVDKATYALKVWIDENTLEDYEGYYVSLGANIVQEPLYSKNIYNISGTISSSSSSSISTIELQNGLYKASTTAGSSGYTLNNVVSGTYNLKVTIDGNVYESTLDISHNMNDTSLGAGRYEDVNIINDNVARSGQKLQSTAYTYNTTPYKIMTLNSFTDSNSVPLQDYQIPSVINLTGPWAIGTVSLDYINFYVENGVLLVHQDR